MFALDLFLIDPSLLSFLYKDVVVYYCKEEQQYAILSVHEIRML